MNGKNKMINIDKNIKVPKGLSANLKYPWDRLEIGDSFFVYKKEEQPERWAKYIVRAGVLWFKNRDINVKLTYRTEKEGDGVRIWRTK